MEIVASHVRKRQLDVIVTRYRRPIRMLLAANKCKQKKDYNYYNMQVHKTCIRTPHIHTIIHTVALFVNGYTSIFSYSPTEAKDFCPVSCV